jgi:hypothetical protein
MKAGAALIFGPPNAQEQARVRTVLRLSQSEGRSQIRIQLSGGLVGEYARLAERCCLEALAAGKRVQVLLRQVTAVDEAGRQLLSTLMRRGVRLRAVDLYCKELLKALRRSLGPRLPVSRCG